MDIKGEGDYMRLRKSYIGKRKLGFTLLELLIGLSLFSVIIVLSYSFLRFSKTTHKKAIDRLDLQQDLKYAIDYISNELSTAFYIEIQDHEYENRNEYLADDKFIESNGDTISAYLYNEDGSGAWVEEEIFAHKNKLEIKQADTENVISITITALDENNKEIDSISTKVYAANMLEGRSNIDSPDGGGSYILYNNTTKESALPTPSRMRFCFFSTLLTENHPYLAVLREFRDNFLAKYNIGRSLIDLYYKFSFKYSNFVDKSNLVRFVLKTILVPIVAIIYVCLRVPYILVLAIILSSIYLYKRRCKKRRDVLEVTIIE
ncbi:MAG: prepilin-type N-terminal cleavage/methylation domain-containing protein [Tissierellia bacterium]|nr:prepilin-type N-terminal cleavage/methylation domain-containing protein [Tissierellia bacterium]